MLEPIVQSHEQLSNFLSTFRDTLVNQPQYRHFQAYVIGRYHHSMASGETKPVTCLFGASSCLYRSL